MLGFGVNEKKWVETCVLCEEEKQRGIHIIDNFLCRDCEQKLVNLPPEDPTYKEHIIKLRKLKASTLLS
ncbi:sigma factor G inhibitor Gin [Bacillus piscicola]|uniref:sigma factor G inhibitor Gin n=1 Tax=Bacillus piscicola TaxID=1632684 RepID=UPI003B830EC7